MVYLFATHPRTLARTRGAPQTRRPARVAASIWLRNESHRLVTPPFPGAHGGVEIPVPIPNTEVKGPIGESTAGVARGRVARRRVFPSRRAGPDEFGVGPFFFPPPNRLLASMSISAPLLSVIIPTFNRVEMVCRCIQSVLDSDFRNLEVVVVDDASTDGTWSRLKEAFATDPRVRLVRNERNLQLGQSRNRGAVLSQGHYLLFLDDDNLVDRSMVSRMIRVFLAHPETGLVAPVAIHRVGRKAGMVWTLGSDFNRWTSSPRDLLPGIPESTIPEDIELFPTTYSPNCFMVPIEVFRQSGGFDPWLPFSYDDSDFAWRSLKSRPAWIVASARTNHMNHQTNGDDGRLRDLGVNTPNRAFLLSRNRIRFVRRHFTVIQRLSVILLFAPLSVLWYGAVALHSRRPDIAWAYLRGYLAGVFSRVSPPPAPISPDA